MLPVRNVFIIDGVDLFTHSIMAGGSSGVYIIQQIRRDERRRQRAWQDRRTKSRSRSLAKHRTRKGAPAAAPREAFACEYLCSECGYLMREQEPHCPSCKSDGVWDLGNTELAVRLRELEEQSRSNIPIEVRAGSYAFSGVAGVGAAIGAAVLLDPLAGLLALIAVPVGLAVSIPRGTALLWKRLRGRVLPSRWRLPGGPAAGSATGPALATGTVCAAETLVSPISKSPCVAWRVVVNFDAPGDAAPRELVVDECEGGAFSVDGQTVEANSYVLDSSSARILDQYEPARHYLRTRGLFGADGEFHIFESVLREGEFIELCGSEPPLVRRPVPAVAVGGGGRL